MAVRNAQQNLVRNLNRRIVGVAKNLGTSSPVYQDYQRQLEYLFPNNIAYKDGVAQLVRPMDLNKTDLEQLNIEGIAQLEKGLRSSYKKYQEETGSKMSIKQYINAQQNITKNLGALYQNFKNADHQKIVNAAKSLMQSKGKPTHKQIVSVGQMIDQLNGKSEKDIDWFGLEELAKDL